MQHCGWSETLCECTGLLSPQGCMGRCMMLAWSRMLHAHTHAPHASRPPYAHGPLITSATIIADQNGLYSFMSCSLASCMDLTWAAWAGCIPAWVCSDIVHICVPCAVSIICVTCVVGVMFVSCAVGVMYVPCVTCHIYHMWDVSYYHICHTCVTHAVHRWG